MRWSLAAVLLVACVQNPQDSQGSGETEVDMGCELRSGNYPVQSARLDNDSGVYSLFVLNTPKCFKQPLKVEELQMMRAEEENSEKAIIQYDGAGGSVLKMTDDFELKVVQIVPNDQGVMQEQSSSWAPFLSGMAGAAVAGLAMNALFNKPQHYMPPQMQPGQTRMAGYGGVGNTPQEAAKSFESKYNAPAPRSAGSKSASSMSERMRQAKEKRLEKKGRMSRLMKSRSSAPKRRRR